METSPPPLSHGLPRSGLQTDALPENARFDIWRESILPLVEPLAGDSGSAEPFHASVEVFHLQHLLIGKASFSGQRFRRTRPHCAGESAEHFLLQMCLKGGYRGHNGGAEIRGKPGDIALLDLGHPLETWTPTSSHLTLLVPRELFFTHAAVPLLPGTLLAADSPLGRIVGNHLLSVWRALPSATAADSGVITEVLMGVVAGALNARAGAADTHGRTVEHATVEAIRRYIDRHLDSPTLTPARLCEHFACSRAQLYRLFQPLGGIASYIREARLKRCLFDLTRGDLGRGRINGVAARWGFTNQSHFCRLFRETFGITPGEAFERRREAFTLCAGQATESERRSELPLYRDWLVNL